MKVFEIKLFALLHIWSNAAHLFC